MCKLALLQLPGLRRCWCLPTESIDCSACRVSEGGSGSVRWQCCSCHGACWRPSSSASTPSESPSRCRILRPCQGIGGAIGVLPASSDGWKPDLKWLCSSLGNQQATVAYALRVRIHGAAFVAQCSRLGLAVCRCRLFVRVGADAPVARFLITDADICLSAGRHNVARLPLTKSLCGPELFPIER
jgi:hypothetical protein